MSSANSLQSDHNIIIKVKVNLGLSFEQNIMGTSLRCFIPNFVEIGPLIPGKNIFKMVVTIYGHGCQLGHVNSIILMNVHFLIPKSLHTKFGLKIAQWFLRKASFNFHMSRNDLDLEYSYTCIFINSISCLYLPTLP